MSQRLPARRLPARQPVCVGVYMHSTAHPLLVVATICSSTLTAAVPTGSAGYRVAVVVSGGFRRFLLNSSAHGLLAPMVRQGHRVDYFLALSLHDEKAWRSDPYLQRLTWDPVFGGPEGDPPCRRSIEEVIRNHVAATGATLRHLVVRWRVSVDDDPQVQARRAVALLKHPKADPDSFFPVRSQGAGAAADANRNILRLFHALRELWDRLEATERKSGRYDYVLFLRDDARWLEEFDLRRLLGPEAPASGVWVLKCDARVPPMAPTETTDHALLAARAEAPLYGRYYDSLFHEAVSGCQVKSARKKLRGCDSEEILQMTLRRNNVTVREVAQSLMPFQRASHVADRDGIITCFHKFCQSKELPLANHGLGKCKGLRLAPGTAPAGLTPRGNCRRRLE